MNVKAYISAPVSAWSYDMDACPVGTKCLLLNLGGVATFGPVDANSKRFFVAWAPLPQRDKDEEKRRGIHL